MHTGSPVEVHAQVRGIPSMRSGCSWVSGALEERDQKVAMLFTLAVPGRCALLKETVATHPATASVMWVKTQEETILLARTLAPTRWIWSCTISRE